MNLQNQSVRKSAPTLIVLGIVILSGCLTGKKLDRQVAKLYGHRVPPVTARNHSEITVSSPLRFNAKAVSSSAAHTSRVLPLLFYWQMDYTNTCILNPAIAVNEFTNAVHTYARRKLRNQLSGRALHLTIEKLPHGFAIDDMSHMIWFIYGFAWERVTLEPQTQDMVVSYTLMDRDTLLKRGEITLENKETSRHLGYFESWKKATGTYIARYNHDVSEMARECVDELETVL